MNCTNCFQQIEKERLTLLPTTNFCSTCAREYNLGRKKKGHMVYGHKTGAEIQIMSESCFEEQKKYWTPIGARSAVKNFSKAICV